MIKPIVNNLRLLNTGLAQSEKTGKIEGSSFSELLKENINRVNNLQKEADQITENFVLGKVDNIHQVTIAAEKAQLALNLTLAVQNKVVEAYKEVMRMQI